jgi:hypothetical protein
MTNSECLLILIVLLYSMYSLIMMKEYRDTISILKKEIKKYKRD